MVIHMDFTNVPYEIVSLSAASSTIFPLTHNLNPAGHVLDAMNDPEVFRRRTACDRHIAWISISKVKARLRRTITKLVLFGWIVCRMGWLEGTGQSGFTRWGTRIVMGCFVIIRRHVQLISRDAGRWGKRKACWFMYLPPIK